MSFDHKPKSNEQEKVLRIRAEQNLADSEEIFRLLVDAVEDYAIFALNIKGYIQTWNLGARRLKGYTPEEVIGTHFRRFYVPADVDRRHPENELRLASETGKYEEEGWRVKKDGSRFWANVVITAMKDENGVLQGYAKVTRDLTIKKNAEEALRESQERFRLMVESVQEYAIFMLSPDGHVSTWNTGAQRLKGYSTDEIIGRHFSTFYPECDIRADKPGMELREAKRVGRFEDEGWRIRKDGTRFWANVVLSAVYNKDKKLIGFSKVTRDLSERKKAEDKLRSAYTDLEEKVELRTSELSIAKARAEQAVRARDEFFSIASHELKTPLTSLKLYTQLRRRRFAKGDLSDFAPDKLEHLVKNDERQVERLVFLVDNLLDISRVNSGSLDLSLEPVDLSALTLEVVGRLSAILKQTGNECLVKAESGVAGSWDRHRLEQVLTNLLSNAGKYAPGKPIEVTVGRKGKVAVLKVTDHGPGISAENLELVFQPFKRVKETTEISGLGLGLFITKQIVEGHGGLIHVESMPGEGCTFSVELPFTLD